MGQYRKTAAGRGVLRGRPAAHFARHIATATLISSGLPFNAALAADPSTTTRSAADAPARKSYDIPAGPLEGALTRFGREAGLLLSFPAALTAGRSSEGLHGEYDVQQALDRLLHGTGLAAQRHSNGAYTLVERTGSTADDDTNDATLPVVAVTSRIVNAGSYRPPPEANITRSDTPILDTAQAVAVVPAQVLRDQRPRNLDDALANVSGIVQGNTLAGTQDTLLKRGFGGNRDGSIMHNGMPLVQGRGLNAAADSIEVLKGPTSLLYGIMDPGGVVSVVSKQPLLTPYHAISVLGSTYGHGRNGGGATLDTTGPIGDSGLAYRLVVDQTNELYWRNFGEHRETLVAPSLAWYGRDTQVVASYEYRKFLYPFDRGTALDPKTNEALAIPSRRRLDEPFNEMDGESHLAQLSVDHQINPNWKAHFGYSYNRETYDANQLRVQGINSTTGAVSRSNDATHGALSTDSYAIAYVDGHFGIAGMRDDLQIGVDDEYRRIYRRDLLRQATKFPFNYFDRRPRRQATPIWW
jgi:iron complex outermembrane receptor protein